MEELNKIFLDLSKLKFDFDENPIREDEDISSQIEKYNQISNNLLNILDNIKITDISDVN